MVSLFCTEHVIQSQNTLIFFVLFPHMPLLVVFEGVLNCCFLCASTQSYRFSITKALNQRTWYQGKDGILFLFAERRKLFCFHDSQKTNPNFLSKQHEGKKKSLFWMILYGLKRSFERTVYLKSAFPEKTKSLFLFEQAWKNSLHSLKSLKLKRLCLSYCFLLEQVVLLYCWLYLLWNIKNRLRLGCKSSKTASSLFLSCLMGDWHKEEKKRKRLKHPSELSQRNRELCEVRSFF